MANVIVGCEESQAVCLALRAKGINAYSCDLLPCSGGHPEWHLQMDVLFAVRGGKLITQSGEEIFIDRWSGGIFFPPCTYLTVAANRHFVNNPERWKRRLNAMFFVYKLMNCKIPKIALENPKGVISSHIRKPDQYIHPYHFGDPEQKMTGLWLKGLPTLTHTNVVKPETVVYKCKHTKSGYSTYGKITGSCSSTNNPENAKLRSKTYPGIANAMAEQWAPIFEKV